MDKPEVLSLLQIDIGRQRNFSGGLHRHRRGDAVAGERLVFEIEETVALTDEVPLLDPDAVVPLSRLKPLPAGKSQFLFEIFNRRQMRFAIGWRKEVVRRLSFRVLMDVRYG